MDGKFDTVSKNNSLWGQKSLYKKLFHFFTNFEPFPPTFIKSSLFPCEIYQKPRNFPEEWMIRSGRVHPQHPDTIGSAKEY